MPIMIDGVPINILEKNRTASADFESRPNSLRYIPESIPTGTPIIAAVTVIIRVPNMAFASPPPLIPGGAGNSVKNAGFKADIPLRITVYRIQPKINNPSRAEAPDKTDAVLLRNFLQNRDRSFIVHPLIS